MNFPFSAVFRPALTGLLLLVFCSEALPANGFLFIKNGSFWDSGTADYFVPRGIAYQIWNPPVGANQSDGQVYYDFLEFKKLHANSVRVEMTWGQVEIGPGQYNWSKPDFMVQTAEKLGLKLFIIIGYQYPPAWFPTNHLGINNFGLRADVVQALAKSTAANALNYLPPQTAQALQNANSPDVLAQVAACLVNGAKAGGVSNILALLESTLTQDELAANLPFLVSDVINYEDPSAQAAYQEYIAAVTDRYKNSPAIGAWILGNEYAYFDLWEDPNLYPVHRFLGYDPISQQSFRQYLQSVYQTNIATLNANWQTNFIDFNAVTMPLEYPPNRYLPGFHDLIQWRKKSIANFVAVGATAAKRADTNHLMTYSMVGGLFNGRDANYTCEDAKSIVSACSKAGAPLDFWSINNYAWAAMGSEMRSTAFGIQKYQAESGLPVMVSETGHSSTEDLFDPDSGARQPKALPSSVWESLLSGAIGVHIFTWNDRSQFTTNYFYRERGFGIVQENRIPKEPVFSNVAAMFRQMENIHLDHLLGGSMNSPAQVQFFWSTNSDMVWPRANQENAMIWGALKRLGFQPTVIDDAGFEAGWYTNSPVLLLSRNYQMNPTHLQDLFTKVLPAGIHIHAQTDLPGQFDAYCRANTNWVVIMREVFGIDASLASPGFDLISTNDCYSPIHLQGTATLGSISPAYAVDLTTWKFWQNVLPASATTILTGFGFSQINGSQPNCPYLNTTPYPELLINAPSAGPGKTAVNPFALGDTGKWSGTEAGEWDIRYAVLGAIYRNYFGLRPPVDLSGVGAQHVLSSYRICSNGSVLISLLNEDTNAAILTISSPSLLQGRTVEDLFGGRVLARNCSGVITYTNQGDDCVVLYAYASSGTNDASLINQSPNKVWMADSPAAVWSGSSPASTTVAYDLRDTNITLDVTLEQVSPVHFVLAHSAPLQVTGRGSVAVPVPLPQADANNLELISSSQGAEYSFHASLLLNSSPVADVWMPVRFLFGVHPTQPLPVSVLPGHSYQVTLGWEELPSNVTPDNPPLDRAKLWDSADMGEYYRVVMELADANGVVISNSIVTTEGTGSNTFSVFVPTNSKGPFSWLSFLQTAPNVSSHNIEESFEGFTRGAKWQGSNLPFLTNEYFLAPWISYVYSSSPSATIWLNEGIQLLGSDGSQSAFVVATNPPNLNYSGFGIYCVFTNGDWTLPSDSLQWTNYTFSFDYMDSFGNLASLDMQVKDASGNWIQYTRSYNQSPGSWVTTQASLDMFVSPPLTVSGPFDPSHVHEIVLNVEMLASNALYVGSFDNIQFLGPKKDQGGGQSIATFNSANDSLGYLAITTNSPRLSISWMPGGILQSASKLTGPWTDITNATSPLIIAPQAPRQFFRTRR